MVLGVGNDAIQGFSMAVDMLLSNIYISSGTGTHVIPIKFLDLMMKKYLEIISSAIS